MALATEGIPIVAYVAHAQVAHLEDTIVWMGSEVP